VSKNVKSEGIGENATADFKQISNSTADFNLGNAGSFVPPISKNINSNKDNLSLANWRESQPPILNKFQIQLPISNFFQTQLPISILGTLVLLSNQYLKISTLTKIIYHRQDSTSRHCRSARTTSKRHLSSLAPQKARR
jgi:hypothetical protein